MDMFLKDSSASAIVEKISNIKLEEKRKEEENKEKLKENNKIVDSPKPEEEEEEEEEMMEVDERDLEREKGTSWLILNRFIYLFNSYNYYIIYIIFEY